jgi:hypothetical protein
MKPEDLAQYQQQEEKERPIIICSNCARGNSSHEIDILEDGKLKTTVTLCTPCFEAFEWGSAMVDGTSYEAREL